MIGILEMDEATAEKLTPMMKQYRSIKLQHKNHILFFRMGDFYEMFFEDAVSASEMLGLALTGRDCGLEERAPMCGLPHHSSESYVSRLVKAGQKVAICEQTENPAFAKGVVSRDVVRVITPGTLVEENLLEEDTNNFLCSIYYGEGGYGLAFADISTGQVNLAQLPDDDSTVVGELAGYSPREVIFNPAFMDKKQIAAFMREKLRCTADLIEDEVYRPAEAEAAVLAHFEKDTLAELGLEKGSSCLLAMGALLHYLAETQKVGLKRLCTLAIRQDSKYILLGEGCRANLELTKTLRTGEKRGSLLWVLDKTRTPMGKRLIKSYITRPLASPAEIERRLNAVSELFGDEMLLLDTTEALGQVKDLERLITRIVYGNATPRDMLSLGHSLAGMPPLKEGLGQVKSEALSAIITRGRFALK